jgi:hypothetical protein
MSGGSRRADVMDTFWWEADVEGRRHGVEGVWMMRRKEGYVDHREEVGRRHAATGEGWEGG